MKIAIIGATSQSTPTLFRALAKSPVLSEMRFALAARNEERLSSIVRAIRVLSDASIECHDCSQAGLTGALARAEVVLLQIRYGGLESREFDETFPLAYGLCGDEGLGPGGLSAAWRAWPALSEVLNLVERTCPTAKLFLLTSPGSLLTRLAHIRWPQLTVRGFCELPWTTLEAASDGRAVAAYDYFGINHLGWIYGLPGQSPLRLKYWRLHFEREGVWQEQRARSESRAAELRRLTNTALEAYAAGSREEIYAAMDLRYAPWYSHAFAPLLESLIIRTASIHFFLSVPNHGWNRDVEDGDILEIPFLWQEGELIRRTPLTPPPAELQAVLAPFIRYERKAAVAMLSREADAVEAALAHHPWITTHAQAKGLAEAIVTQEWDESVPG